jgi:hypothetical protein
MRPGPARQVPGPDNLNRRQDERDGVGRGVPQRAGTP